MEKKLGLICFLFICSLLYGCNSEDVATDTSQKITLSNEETNIFSGQEYRFSLSFSQPIVDAENSDFSLEISTAEGITHTLHYEVQLDGDKKSVLFIYQFDRNSDQLAQNKTISFQIHFQGDMLKNLDLSLFDEPEMDELNWPQRSLYMSSRAIQSASNGEADFYWLNLAPWKIPENPTWQEDPYGNISWQMSYHSLGWLTSWGALFLQTKDQALLTRIENLIIDYDSTFSGDGSELAYREDVVALRTNHILYLYLKLYDQLTEPCKNALKSLISKDFGALLVYLNDEQYDDDNHGLIQARSALNLSAVFPLEDRSEKLRTDAIARLAKAATNMFATSSGFIVEQAVDYHFIGISMLLEAKGQLDKLGIEVPFELVSTLEKAIKAGAYLLYDDGTVPAIGDSYYGGFWLGYLARYVEINASDPDLLSGFLQSGQDALEDTYYLADERLLIIKHRNTSGLLDKVFFDIGKPRQVHGHFDNLNILAEFGSERLLVDSGGPYTYSYKGRGHFWSKPAHNNLVINGLIQHDGEANLNFLTQTDSSVIAQGTLEWPGAVTQFRTLILDKKLSSTMIAIDQVTNPQQTMLSVDEYWHFPKGALVTQDNASNMQIKLPSGTIFNNYRFGDTSFSCRIREGESDNSGIPALGWVTAAYNEASSAPVSFCHADTRDFIRINIFTRETADNVRVEISKSGFVIFVAGEVFEVNKSNRVVRQMQ